MVLGNFDIGNTALVVAVMGTTNYNLNKSPVDKKNSYCFTNNPKLFNECEIKGWTYRFIDCPLQTDIALSSIDAKRVKTLQIADYDSELTKKFSCIICLDIKVLNKLKKDNIIETINKFDDKYVIMVREDHPESYHYNKDIYKEFTLAMKQERYRRYKVNTEKYIKDNIKKYGMPGYVHGTGFLVYNTKHKEFNRLTKQFYDEIIKHGSPECQIVFPFIILRNKKLVQVSKWYDVGYRSLM